VRRFSDCEGTKEFYLLTESVNRWNQFGFKISAIRAEVILLLDVVCKKQVLNPVCFLFLLKSLFSKGKEG
jgi:hypothetical protein